MSESRKVNLDGGEPGTKTGSKGLVEDLSALMPDGEEELESPWQPTTADDVLQYLRENLVNSFADPEFRESLLAEDILVGDGGSCRFSVAESVWDGKPCYVVEGHSRGVANGVRWKSQVQATIEIPSLGTVRQKRVLAAESCVEDGVDDDPLDTVECATTVEMLKRPYTPVEEPPKDVMEGEDEDEPKNVGEGGENAEEQPPVPMHVTYRVTKTLKREEDREETERVLTEDESNGFFPDAALVLLLKCLAKLRFENLPIPLRLVDFDPDFELCAVTCVRSGDVNVGEVDKETEEGKKALRFFLEQVCSDGVVYNTETHLLSSGEIIYWKQDDPYLELFRPVKEKMVEKEESKESVTVERPAFPKTELVMEEDLELFSKYQDRMEELKACHGTYLRQHPELKTILADFLQEVVTIKPAKFLPFAASYFSTFRQVDASSRKASRMSRPRSSVTSVPCVCESPEPDD